MIRKIAGFVQADIALFVPELGLKTSHHAIIAPVQNIVMPVSEKAEFPRLVSCKIQKTECNVKLIPCAVRN